MAGISDTAAGGTVRDGGGGGDVSRFRRHRSYTCRYCRTAARRPWYSKLLSLCFVIFCFEIGVFLVVFPWMEIWEANQVANFAPWLADLWGSPYFRGALSGLGLVNIYISLAGDAAAGSRTARSDRAVQ